MSFGVGPTPAANNIGCYQKTDCFFNADAKNPIAGEESVRYRHPLITRQSRCPRRQDKAAVQRNKEPSFWNSSSWKDIPLPFQMAAC
jgi:hypothetical protein